MIQEIKTKEEAFTKQALIFYLDLFNQIRSKKLKGTGPNFLLKKLGMESSELVLFKLEKETVLSNALALAKETGQEYISSVFILVSYLLLTEDQSKLLFNKKIKREDLIKIAGWCNSILLKEEIYKVPEFSFGGEGIFEPLIFGWTTETKKYSFDITHALLSESFPIYGRTTQYKRIIDGLAQGKSILLLGDPGAGKRTLLSKFLDDSTYGRLGGGLNHQRIFQLMVDNLLSGVENQGQMESRLSSIIAEMAHAGNVLVYIQNLENILGASTFKLDLSGSILPYLENKSLRFVATSTQGAFKKFIQERHDLLSNFEIIRLDRSPDEDLFMLLSWIGWFELKKGPSFTYNAIISALDNGEKYTKDLDYMSLLPMKIISNR